MGNARGLSIGNRKQNILAKGSAKEKPEITEGTRHGVGHVLVAGWVWPVQRACRGEAARAFILEDSCWGGGGTDMGVGGALPVSRVILMLYLSES